MHSPEITAEFMHRLAVLLDGEAVTRPGCNDGRLPVIRLHSPRVLLTLSHAWHARPKWHASALDWQGKHIHGSPSANFTSSRPIEEIAADLRRRVLDPARAHLIRHASHTAAADLKHQQAAHRLAELETICGPSKPYHNGYANLTGLRIPHEYHLQDRDGPWASFHAEITLHSFEALKMIARIVAEDHRLHSTKSTQDSASS
jgi:hypothetical protein